jgi:hypothetical protein
MGMKKRIKEALFDRGYDVHYFNPVELGTIPSATCGPSAMAKPEPSSSTSEPTKARL